MGSVTITAIAVLESSRVQAPNKPKSLIFDAQIWLPSDHALIAGLRYFNNDDHDFDGKVNKCLIIANVVKYTKNMYPLLSSEMSDGDYDLFGDIILLSVLPEVTDPRAVPFIQFAGTCEEAEETSFTMSLAPRLSNMADVGVLAFPVMGHFRNLARYEHWKDGKPPVPQPRSNAFVCGLLTSTTGRGDGKAPDCFHVDVETVTYLARSPPPIPRGQQRDGPKTPRSTPKKLAFDFASLDSPETPTKKRKTRSGVNAEAGPSNQP